jgi:hypothetical protein
MPDPKFEFKITGSGEVRDSDGNLLNQESDEDDGEREL